MQYNLTSNGTATMTFSLPFGVLRSYYRSATTQMLSILDTGMNAPTHSTLNDGKHT